MQIAPVFFRQELQSQDIAQSQLAPIEGCVIALYETGVIQAFEPAPA